MTARISPCRDPSASTGPRIDPSWKRLVETMPVAALWIDLRKRRLLAGNRAAAALYRRAEEEWSGFPVAALFAGRRGSVVALRRALEQTVSARHCQSDGGILDVELSATLQEPGLALLYVVNRSASGDAGERHLRAQRLECIGNLAAGMAHDFNNILTPVLMSAPLLREPCDASVRDELLEAVEESAQRGVHLVRQVLTFARGQTGEQCRLQPEELIREVVSLARRTFPRSVEIRSRFGNSLWEIEGNATRIHQVLLNLVINARDAMEPQGGVVQVSARNRLVNAATARKEPEARPGRYVAFMVRDSGVGIPREHLEKVFIPFFTTKDPDKGTGLGLPTVREIVRRHGGFITVESEVGKGSLFTAFFPAAGAAANSAGERPAPVSPRVGATPPAAPANRGKKHRILVIDDDPGLRRMVRAVLNRKGFDVTTEEGGKPALERLARNPKAFELVLVDLVLPEMDGFAIARAIREIAPELPIVATSGLDNDARLRRMEAFGMQRFLKKPYPPEVLLSLVEEVMQARKGSGKSP